MAPRLLLLVLLCAGATQVPTFKAGVETVRVDILVTRDGRPVTDLGPADFEVKDEGVLQRVEHAAFEEIPLNVVFAIDASASITGDRADRLRRACHAVLSELKRGDHAGLVVFGDSMVVQPLSADLAAVRTAIERPLPPGETSLADAVQTSILLAESEPGRALVILFSDGIDVSSYLPADAVLETARRSDAVVYVVAPRGVRRSPFVRDVAEASGGDVFEIASPADVEAAFRKILDEFRHRYLLSYAPEGVAGAGWHRLEVRVKQRGASVKARPGYFRQ